MSPAIVIMTLSLRCTSLDPQRQRSSIFACARADLELRIAGIAHSVRGGKAAASQGHGMPCPYLADGARPSDSITASCTAGRTAAILSFSRVG